MPRFTTISGSHAVVTGGSSGIGLATARLLAERGARVSLIARRPEQLESAAAELRHAGGDILTAPADVADPDALGAAIDGSIAEMGPCDILVASAGVSRPGHFVQLEVATFRRLMDVNYFGTLHAVRAVVPSMVARGRGSVVGVSSAAGLIGVFGFTAYAPTKFAVRGLLESLRGELAPHGVHVGCVYPPDVDTPMLTAEEQFKPEETKAISGAIEPISADQVARATVRGIERGTFSIAPDWRTRLLARTSSLAPEAFAMLFDRTVRRSRTSSMGQ
ncbi:MAG: SDR family oxidoreductase [Acidimicrobiia bacterium]